jgi:hypothetical protein
MGLLVNATPRPLYPRDRGPASIVQLGGLRCRLGWYGKYRLCTIYFYIVIPLPFKDEAYLFYI